jgi:hypothetical protein
MRETEPSLSVYLNAMTTQPSAMEGIEPDAINGAVLPAAPDPKAAVDAAIALARDA